MNRFYLVISLSLLIACASTPESHQPLTLSSAAYEGIIEDYSDRSQSYDGPYNIIDVTATLLNSHVLEAQTLRQADMFHWDKDKVQIELKSRADKSLQKTEVFVSLFTPERKSGDLMRAETLWKTILTVDGREVPGQPKKLTLLPIEIVSLYPMHNRWSTGYLVSFDIPLKDVETKKSQLVITGPLGSTTLKFRPVKEGPLLR